MVGVARQQPETYERAKITLPLDIDEVAVPEGLETEESLGTAPTDEEAADSEAADSEAADNDAAFDIEVNGSDEGAEHVERAPDIEEETVLRDAPRPLVTPRPRKRKTPSRFDK